MNLEKYENVIIVENPVINHIVKGEDDIPDDEREFYLEVYCLKSRLIEQREMLKDIFEDNKDCFIYIKLAGDGTPYWQYGDGEVGERLIIRICIITKDGKDIT